MKTIFFLVNSGKKYCENFQISFRNMHVILGPWLGPWLIL